MKCPHCQEELGLNNICINVLCSHFGTEINSSDNSNLNYTINDLDTKNSYNNESNIDNFNANPNLNNTYDNMNDYSYNRHNYDNKQSINETTNKSSNIYNNNNNISIEEFSAFIGNHNTDYYLEHIHKMKSNNRFLSWNWPCFFLGPYWFLYRKLYSIASILIALTISLSLIFHSKTPMFFTLLVRIILAIFANAIYLNICARKIKTVKTIIANLSTTQYINKLHKKGGVNLIAPLILLAICIVIIIISIVVAFLFISGNNTHQFSSPSYHY